ncbi:MAG: RNA polymerase sigma factor SigM [Roseiflexaceae bacterium]
MMDREQTIDEICQTYQAELLRFLFRIVRQWELAEDLCQETFLRAYMAGEKFQQVTHQRAWLYRVARNLAIDSLRSHARQPRSESLDQLHEGQHPATSIAIDSHMLIEESLAQLKPDVRQLFEMHYLQAMQIDEIATQIRRPSNTIRSQLFRARASMRAAAY